MKYASKKLKFYVWACLTCGVAFSACALFSVLTKGRHELVMASPSFWVALGFGLLSLVFAKLGINCPSEPEEKEKKQGE